MTLEQILARLAVLKTENETATAERLLEIDTEVKSLLAQKTALENPPIDGVAIERQRASEITSLCREFEVSPDEFIKNGDTLDNVRVAILDQIKKKNPATKGGGVDVTVTKDAMDKFKAAAVDGILLKGGISIEKPVEGAKDLRVASLVDLARE